MISTLEAVRTELQRYFQALYGSRLDRLILYGSQARGDAEPGSDIDVLIVLNGSVDPHAEMIQTSAIVADLSLRHDEVISCFFISSQRFYREQSPLLLNVRREGIPL